MLAEDLDTVVLRIQVVEIKADGFGTPQRSANEQPDDGARASRQ
jgi:hypothetical protein